MHGCVNNRTPMAARNNTATYLICSLQVKEGRWVPGRAVQYYDVAGYLVGRWAGAFTLLITVISLFSTSMLPALSQSSRSQAHTSCEGAGGAYKCSVDDLCEPQRLQ